MAVISFKTLNNNVQDAISTGKFPEKKLRELSANLKASQKKDFKFTIIIVAIMAVFIGGLFDGGLVSGNGLAAQLLMDHGIEVLTEQEWLASHSADS